MIVPADNLDIVCRLLAAAGVGIAFGLDRDLHAKATGMRTLGLVSLGAATVSLAGLQLAELTGHPDALSRVVQGIFQGILTGVGFIGAGVILHLPETSRTRGLTTAATVWMTAALGIACAFGQWVLVASALGLSMVILLFLRTPDRALLARAIAKHKKKKAHPDAQNPPSSAS